MRNHIYIGKNVIQKDWNFDLLKPFETFSSFQLQFCSRSGTVALHCIINTHFSQHQCASFAGREPLTLWSKSLLFFCTRSTISSWASSKSCVRENMALCIWSWSVSGLKLSSLLRPAAQTDRSDSNQGTDYMVNDYIVLSSWISGFLRYQLKIESIHLGKKQFCWWNHKLYFKYFWYK